MGQGRRGITYLDGRRLSRSLLAAADWVDARRDELNRINVFPVPDGDTGTNFAVTLRAGAEAVRSLQQAPLPAVADAAAEAYLYAARGNSGLLLSQFFLGFRDAIGSREAVGTAEVARAIRRGAEQLGAALDQPVEGTILTVSRDVAAAAEAAAAQTRRLEELLRNVVDRAWASLRRTPELLAALREAGVVDAGAKAFVLALEGVARLAEGKPAEPVAAVVDAGVGAAAARVQVAPERDFRFCTEVLVRGSSLPAAAVVRAKVRALGGSIVVLNTGSALKVHVHTDTPERLFELAAEWGAIATTKAEDMQAQHRSLTPATRRIAIVVDSSCDLASEHARHEGIAVVPLQVIAGGRTYLDGVDLPAGEVYELMRHIREPLTTSQPTPGAFARALKEARTEAPEILCLVLSGALSGTLTSAQAAARSVGADGIVVLDSRSASLGLGMLALRGAELVDQGLSLSAVVEELTRVRDRSGGIFTVDTFENLRRSGRVSRGKAWVGRLLDVKPILEVDRAGRVVPLDRVRGREAVLPRVLRYLDRRLTPRPRRLRLGVAHADVPEVAEGVRTTLVRRYEPHECLVGPVTAAIGVHAGPGAWGVFYQIDEDGPAGPRDRPGGEPFSG